MAVDDGTRATDRRMKNLDVRLQKAYFDAYLKACDNNEKAIEKLAKFAPDALREKGMTEAQIRTAAINYKTQVERTAGIVKNIANEIANTSETARKIIEGEKLNIFDINYRGALDSVDNQLGFAVDWTIYDKNQLKAILDSDIMPFEKVGAREKYVRAQKDIARGYVRERAYGRLGDDKAITARLQNELLQAIILGESIPQITTRIKQTADVSRRQARTIARTETLRVANQGRMLGFGQAADMGIEMDKQWIATNDKRTRDSHLHMHGEKVGVNDKFSNGLYYPLDPDGPPEEVINCRCTMVSVLKGYSFSGGAKKQGENVLTNAPDSGIMDSGGGKNVMFDSEKAAEILDKQEPISQDIISRVKNNLAEKGVILDQSAEIDNYLLFTGKEAATYSDGTMIMHTNVSASGFYEELIHYGQLKLPMPKGRGFNRTFKPLAYLERYRVLPCFRLTFTIYDFC